VPDGEMPPDATSIQGNYHPVANRDIFALPFLPYRQARTAMLVIAALLGLVSVTSLVCFGYQFYRLWATGGAYVPTTVLWSKVLGHLVYAGGLALMGRRLLKTAFSIDAETGELSDQFAPCHRSFWRTSALVLSLFAVYAIFEAAHTWQNNTSGIFFRPEFESGYVEVKPERIEFRRGSEEPVNGWLQGRTRKSETDLFFSPSPEITGKDIRRALVRIAEVFPGSQAVVCNIQFTDEGALKMEKFTKGHLTKPLAVLIDGQLRAAPRIFSPISADAQLSNVFTLEEALHMIREGSD
jgi:hypothetical protein